jgi:hypothetical protein
MARVPTVRLQKADGQIIKVNAANYADDIEGWLSKGFKLVGEEARGGGAATVKTGKRNREPRSRKGVRQRAKPVSES